MWNELQDLGIEDIIKEAIAEGLPVLMKIYISKDGTRMIPIVLMKDAEVMTVLREMLTDADYYRKVNLEELEKAQRHNPDNPWIDGRIGIIKTMSDAEVIVNLPKFLRLCIEMLDRGFDLGDILFDKPH